MRLQYFLHLLLPVFKIYCSSVPHNFINYSINLDSFQVVTVATRLMFLKHKSNLLF